jgi:hypothetical protein
MKRPSAIEDAGAAATASLRGSFVSLSRDHASPAITAMGYPCLEIDWGWMLQAEGQGHDWTRR